MRGLGTSHNVPISPVRAEEKVARSSLHLIYFPAAFFSQAFRGHREAKPVPDVLHTGLLFPSQPSTTRAITCLASPVRAEEKVARSSSHLIHFPADIFSSLQRNTRRRNRCQRFFTSDFLSSRVTAEEKVARSSSHLIYFPADIFSSLQRNTGRRNRC